MKNIGEMLQQAQKMQQKMAGLQEELQKLEVCGQAGGSLVQVTISGKGQAQKFTIDPSLMEKDEREVLEDLLVAAFNDAKAKLDQLMADKTAEAMQGFSLPPGMNLPF